MSLKLPQRGAGKRGLGRSGLLFAALGAALVSLSACSSESQGEWQRVAMPDPATEQGEHILSLWVGAWIAAMVTGVIVWGLIFYASWRFRRRSDDEIPVQTRYNLPLEVFYTIAPVIMVVAFFAQTIDTQNKVLERSAEPDNIVEITAQQWSWSFNHGIGEPDFAADDELFDETFSFGEYTTEVGDASYIPTLVLPVGETTRFNLHAPDVIHSFGIPGFLMKMDVVPGRVNSFEVTPKDEGTYAGKCYELCGVYHSRMLFNVEVVSPEAYADYVEELAEKNGTTELPLIGPDYSRTQKGAPVDHELEGAEQ